VSSIGFYELYQWLAKMLRSLLNRKSAIEHGAFSADSPGNQAVGRWETLPIQQEKD
jgi:hypothetical protein